MPLQVRALIAIVLMVGFYALSLAVVGLLLWIPYAEWTYLDRLDLRIAIACCIGAFVVFTSILPRRDKFSAPGPRISPDQQPRLFAELQEVAKATNQRMPHEVYLIPDVNAWVAQRGGVMGFGSRRVMGLGVPLMGILTVPQFKAVIAHEFGHYYGGDTALGPWIYKTRSAIARTLAQLRAHNSLVIFLFNWYGKLFMRVTLAISRAQEHAADRIAAAFAGANVMMEGLKRIHLAAAAWNAYMSTEIVPVLNEHFSPPLTAGFRHFLAVPTIDKAAHEDLETELREGKANPYDSHPALPQRIAALEAMPNKPAADERLATALLDDLETIDKNLFIPVENVIFRPVEWDATAEIVWIPVWREQVTYQAEALHGLKPADLPTQFSSGTLASRLQNPPGILADSEQRKQIAQGVAGCALALALVNSGWTPHVMPGEFFFDNGTKNLRPFELTYKLGSGEITADEWQKLVQENEIGELALGMVANRANA